MKLILGALEKTIELYIFSVLINDLKNFRSQKTKTYEDGMLYIQKKIRRD